MARARLRALKVLLRAPRSLLRVASVPLRMPMALLRWVPKVAQLAARKVRADVRFRAEMPMAWMEAL